MQKLNEIIKSLDGKAVSSYGEDDINEYFKIFGTWRGIEDYLSERMAQRQAKATETT